MMNNSCSVIQTMIQVGYFGSDYAIRVKQCIATLTLIRSIKVQGVDPQLGRKRTKIGPKDQNPFFPATLNVYTLLSVPCDMPADSLCFFCRLLTTIITITITSTTMTATTAPTTVAILLDPGAEAYHWKKKHLK